MLLFKTASEASIYSELANAYPTKSILQFIVCSSKSRLWVSMLSYYKKILLISSSYRLSLDSNELPSKYRWALLFINWIAQERLRLCQYSLQEDRDYVTIQRLLAI